VLRKKEKMGWAASGVGLEKRKREEGKGKEFSNFKTHSSK
jgi:hypothetical protein